MCLNGFFQHGITAFIYRSILYEESPQLCLLFLLVSYSQLLFCFFDADDEGDWMPALGCCVRDSTATMIAQF